MVGSSLAGVKRGRGLGERKKERGGGVTMKHQPRGGFVSGGFSEKKGLWDLLSLAGSQTSFRSILFCICLSFSFSRFSPSLLPYLRQPRRLGGSGLRISLI